MSMFSKILGKNKDSKNEASNEKLLEKIIKMDLSDMRLYVNGKLNEYKVNNFGLFEIVKKLTLANDESSKLYIKPDDMDSKKKKVFDLIILILSHKEISINTLEMVQMFLETYDEIIKKYDKENKQIYESKIKDSISIAADKINFKSDVANQMRTLG